MTPNAILIINFEETRRRSINVWNGIPPAFYTWRPDKDAMCCLEMVRHVLEGEHLFHQIVNNRGNLGDYPSPWNELPYSDVTAELTFAQPYRQQFIQTVQSFSVQDLAGIDIIRTEAGQKRKLGDYLLRIAYHESVHTGQLLSYLRTLQVNRPKVWD
jgi:uncharacterized damage-inducible protein DinB